MCTIIISSIFAVDLSSTDKMNYDSAELICTPKVREQLLREFKVNKDGIVTVHSSDLIEFIELKIGCCGWHLFLPGNDG